MGAQISEDYRGKCPIVVGVLKGVVPFYAAMTQAITIPIQEDFMCVTSFEGGTASTGKLTFRKDIDHDIEGRDVLILEDILDSGRTLKLIVELFEARKPKSVKICTLLDKPTGPHRGLEGGLCALHGAGRLRGGLWAGLPGLLPQPPLRGHPQARGLPD